MSSSWQWRTLDYWVQWYSDMARNPEAKHYAWDRVNQMARDWPDFYGELPDLLEKEIKHDSTTAKPEV